MKYLIKNVRIVNVDEDFVGDVLLGEGKILEIKKGELTPGSKIPDPGVGIKIINGTGKILMPGLIDPHVHFRDPGLTHKEDFASGSRAAVAGGVTTVFDMPNTIPPVFTCEDLERKREVVASKSLVNWGLFFGGGDENVKEIKKAHNIPGVKLYLNFTTGNLKTQQEATWRKIFHAGKKVALHAEGEVFARAVEIWKEEGTPCELHLCHTSLASEVELVRKLKLQGLLITAEACPHHLLLTENCDNPLATMKPDLRSKGDRDALWKGISDSTIDILSTDHAPHSIEEKKKHPPSYGIPGVETLFPLMFTEFQKRGLSFQKFVQMTSSRTREVFHIQNKKGAIKEGWDGDVVLIDPETKWNIDASQFFSKAKWSPFDGFPVRGKIEKTFLHSELVFDSGESIDKDFRGKEILF